MIITDNSTTKKKNATIYDVAKTVGVSPKTVSNYINKSAPVKKETGARISEAIKKLDYKPNIIARGLRTGRTKNIGIITLNIANSFYPSLIDAIEEKAFMNEYSVTISCNYYDLEREKKHLNTFIQNGIAGLILCSGLNDMDLIKNVQKNNIPIVALDRKIKDEDIPYVGIDNYKAFYRATEYLIKTGHKKIYYLTEPIIMATLEDRLRGYKQALNDNNIKLQDDWVKVDQRLQNSKVQGGYEVFEELLKNGDKPDAVFGVADTVIYGAMKAAYDNGLRIPEDISFMGNNDIYISKYIMPELATIRWKKRKMGEKAFEILFDLINKKKIRKKKYIFETEIIERKTIKIRN